MLDEPTNGLDPAGIVEIRTLLRAQADEGRTVVVSSHLLGEIEAMVDEVVVIRFGELLYAGSLDGLLLQASERVVAAPEHSADLPQLVAVVEANGWSYETHDDRVVVEIPASSSADLFRAASDAGLALAMLTPQQDTLETVFLKLTGADVELAERRSNQRHEEGT